MLELLLRKIEKENEREKYWIVGPKTGHFLHWLVRVVAPRTVVEIGTSVGYSALWMAAALEENGFGELWTIESHAERFEKAKGNFAETDLGRRIHQIKGHAPSVFESEGIVPEHIDFAFLDATKNQHVEFFEAVFPRMSAGGMIVADNVHSHRLGEMQEFVDRMHGDFRLRVVEIPVGDGLLIARIA